MVFSDTINVATKGFSDIVDITPALKKILEKSGLHDGIAAVFCPGSTGAITTIEYESGVLEDLKRAIEKLAPSGVPYAHDARWGDGNGFSHVRAALLGPSLTVPIVDRELTLGTWQQIVFIDFDNRRRQRRIQVQLVGD